MHNLDSIFLAGRVHHVKVSVIFKNVWWAQGTSEYTNSLMYWFSSKSRISEILGEFLLHLHDNSHLSGLLDFIFWLCSFFQYTPFQKKALYGGLCVCHLRKTDLNSILSSFVVAYGIAAHKTFTQSSQWWQSNHSSNVIQLESRWEHISKN